jgi:hypothetical protein
MQVRVCEWLRDGLTDSSGLVKRDRTVMTDWGTVWLTLFWGWLDMSYSWVLSPDTKAEMFAGWGTAWLTLRGWLRGIVRSLHFVEVGFRVEFVHPVLSNNNNNIYIYIYIIIFFFFWMNVCLLSIWKMTLVNDTKKYIILQVSARSMHCIVKVST